MYLARNSNGCLFLHEQKPLRIRINKDKGYWESKGYKLESAKNDIALSGLQSEKKK